MSERQFDVVIAGGAFVGLTLAIALRQGLGPAFRVAVADPALGREVQDARASAIVAAARRLLETIGVWDRVAAEAQPITDMAITDSRLQDAMRPVFLTFGGDAQPGEPLAHMVENVPLLAALTDTARAEGVEFIAEGVSDFAGDRLPASVRPDEDTRPGAGGVSQSLAVTLANGERLFTKLLVAADGARSKLRERAGIAVHGWSYPQSAIVATVAHERDHHGRAEEHFLPAGPFAILPLKNNRSSIVWTEETREAERLVTLPDAEFHAELERRFGLHLGEVAVAGERRVFPLEFQVARSFIADRLALIGDAAHVIHPIAGQGLNLGLKDVAALAETIVDAVRLGLDPGSEAVLERYQRWRRFDTMAMGAATDGLNRLFSNRSDLLRLVRDVGLGVVDRLPALKRMFMREAAGLSGDVPKLLRGEAL